MAASLFEERGIGHQFARRRAARGSNLGKTRWVVERTIAWLHQSRRLRIGYERLPSIHPSLPPFGLCPHLLAYYEKRILSDAIRRAHAISAYSLVSRKLVEALTALDAKHLHHRRPDDAQRFATCVRSAAGGNH